MTRAEKIRTLSDEELADLFLNFSLDYSLRVISRNRDQIRGDVIMPSDEEWEMARDDILKELREEAQEDD